MIQYTYSFLLLFFLINTSNAQFELIFDMNFDNCDATSGGFTTNTVQLTGSLDCTCGVSNEGVTFSGDDHIQLTGPIEDFFQRNDFSISFYFKPLSSGSGRDIILSKRSGTCDNNGVFEIAYNYPLQSFEFLLSASNLLQTDLVIEKDPNAAFQYVTIQRDGRTVWIYLNGRLVSEVMAVQTIDIESNGPVLIGNDICGGSRLQGVLDELSMHNIIFSQQELKNKYIQQGEILNRLDTIIYLGDAVNINLSPTCATSYNWVPNVGVSNPSIKEPTIRPTAEGDYVYYYTGRQGNFTETDSIRIKVVDASKLACQAYFPNAFTPNGDRLNDRFRMVNSIAVDQLYSLEVFDHLGNRIYLEEKANFGWNGTFGGKEVPPGVYYYRARFQCGIELFSTEGSITLLR